MSSVKSFEELFVWQKARELVNLIYRYVKKPGFNRDFGLVDQIQRAAVSVMSNIAEGFERGGKDETVYFLYIAKGSCGEVRTQLYIAFDQNYLNQEEFKKGIELAKYVSALILKFIESLKVSKFKGLKFKKPESEKQKKIEALIRSVLPPDHPSLQ